MKKFSSKIYSILGKNEIISRILKKAYYGDYFSTEDSQIDDEEGEENKKRKELIYFLKNMIN